MKKEIQISCPGCGHKIDINEIVYGQIADEMKSDFSKKAAEDKKEIELKLRKQITEEKNEQLDALQEELQLKSQQVKELNKTKAELERAKREKEELKGKIEAEAELKFSATLNSEREKMKKDYDSKNDLKISEKEHLIDSLKTQIQILTRKVEQGSMQLQGEVMEIAIEEYLKKSFPQDEIIEIKKGQAGADCLQIVNTRIKNNVGTMYFESKRSKEFQISWIEKFKTDMRARGASIGILVTATMPKDMERLGQRDGIWICSLEEFKGLCFVLRSSLITLDEAISTQENKGDKMNLLYDFLTGQDFRMQIEAIVEGFSQMENDLQSEKRSMESIWKKREKQIQKVILNTIHMYSTIKGIAGNSVATISILELPGQEENNI